VGRLTNSPISGKTFVAGGDVQSCFTHFNDFSNPQSEFRTSSRIAKAISNVRGKHFGGSVGNAIREANDTFGEHIRGGVGPRGAKRQSIKGRLVVAELGDQTPIRNCFRPWRHLSTCLNTPQTRCWTHPKTHRIPRRTQVITAKHSIIPPPPQITARLAAVFVSLSLCPKVLVQYMGNTAGSEHR